MTTPPADFLDELEDLRRLEEELAKLKRIKAASEDPIVFGQTYLPKYFQQATPDFHRELIRLAKDKTAPEWDNPDGTKKAGVVLAAPRGHAKSTVMTLILPMWWAVFRKKQFIVVVSNTTDQAKYFVSAIKQEFEQNTLLREDFGEMCGSVSGAKWTEGDVVICHYDTVPDNRPGHEGRVTYAANFNTRIVGRGTNASLRGLRNREARPDAIIADDLENDELVATPEQRAKASRWFNSALRPMIDPITGHIVVVGTILHFDSLLNNLLAKTTVYLTRIYRAVHDEKDCPLFGKPLWPERFSLPFLMSIKDDDELAYSQEYMNYPLAASQRVFRPEWFQWYTYNELEYRKPGDPARNLHVLLQAGTATGRLRKREEPGWYWRGKKLKVAMSIDPAISEKQDADDFVIVVMGCTPDYEIVHLATFAEHLPFDQQVDIIGELEAAWQPFLTFIEGISYQRVLRQHVKGRFPWMRINAVDYHGVQKYVRIKTMSRPVRDGYLFLRASRQNENGMWERGTSSEKDSEEVRPYRIHEVSLKLYKQLIQFPRAAHDDVPDATQQLLDYFLSRRIRKKTFENYNPNTAEYLDMDAQEYADQKRAEGKVIGGGLPDEGADYPAHIEETLPPKHERAPIPQYDKGVYRRRYTDSRGRAIVPR